MAQILLESCADSVEITITEYENLARIYKKNNGYKINCKGDDIITDDELHNELGADITVCNGKVIFKFHNSKYRFIRINSGIKTIIEDLNVKDLQIHGWKNINLSNCSINNLDISGQINVYMLGSTHIIDKLTYRGAKIINTGALNLLNTLIKSYDHEGKESVGTICNFSGSYINYVIKNFNVCLDNNCKHLMAKTIVKQECTHDKTTNMLQDIIKQIAELKVAKLEDNKKIQELEQQIKNHVQEKIVLEQKVQELQKGAEIINLIKSIKL